MYCRTVLYSYTSDIRIMCTGLYPTEIKAFVSVDPGHFQSPPGFLVKRPIFDSNARKVLPSMSADCQIMHPMLAFLTGTAIIAIVKILVFTSKDSLA